MQASAHEPSKSYLSLMLDTNGITGQWDIPLRDLRSVVALGTNNIGPVTWDDLRAGYQAITAYASAHLKIKSGGQSGALRFTDAEPTVENFSDGPYIELPLVVEGLPRPETLGVEYRLFFETNSLHRGLLRLECNGQTQSAVFSPEQPAQSFEIGAVRPGRQFLAFLREGIRHIWTGYDHILFLLALLLPAVLQREGGDWRGATSFRPAFMNVFKIVTAFTLAHSLTLSLATLGIVRLPSRLTESAIAASVVLAAANNLWPMVRERGWLVAFGFGLVHGFGFANALSELGLARGALALALVGFNLGVEIGQLAIVGVFLPLAYALRRSWSYQQLGLRLGSAFIVLMAGVWLLERAFNFKVLPF
jgi:HupE/UreJ protein